MKKITTESLLSELEKQASLFQDTISVGQVENIKYAMNCIQPVRHQEYAFVVWCGTRPEPVTQWVDEFVRRRAGNLGQMPDYSMLNLSRWCVPESYRIPVYREQFQALIKELTGNGSPAKASDVLTEIYQSKIQGKGSYDYFHDLLNDTWKNALTETDKVQLFEIIQDSYPRSSKYAWCSTIVERAIKESIN